MSRPSAAAAGAVALVAALPFLPSLSGGFLQWDDAANLLRHDAWRGLSPAHLRWMATTTHMGPWQPLSWLSYALDHAAWGLNPLGFRLTNLLLHAATAGLLTLTLETLLAAGAPDAPPRRRRLAAAAGALLWALHPLRAEAVCWITERREVLSGLLYVLSVLLYVRRPARLFPAWLAFTGACLAKGSALTLPLTLIVLDAYPLRRPWRTPAVLLEKVPFLLVSLAVGAAGLAGQAADASLSGLASAGPDLRAALALRGLSFYLEKTLWPARLSPFYGVPENFGLQSPIVLACAALVFAAATAAWLLRRRLPALGAALAHHAIALAPLLGIVRFGEQLAADRYAYLSSFGWAALAAAALLRARVLPAAAAAALALGALGALTWRQSTLWRSDLALWSAAEAVAGPSAPAPRQVLVNLAAALRAAGRVDEAAARETAIVAAYPDLVEPRVNLGGWLAAQGRFVEAERVLRPAPPHGPQGAKARYNRALALEGLGRRPEAIAELRAALAAQPAYAEAHNNLGLALLRQGRAQAAESRLAEAARLRPNWALPRYNRGNALAALGRHDEARAAYAEAVRLDPAFADAWTNGGNSLARLGRLAEALSWYDRALALDPRDAAAAENRRRAAALLGSR